MLLPRRPAGWPEAKAYHSDQPGFGENIAWLRKQLKTVRDEIYISSGEAEHQVYSLLEEDFKAAKDETGSSIHLLAGPVITVPEDKNYEKKQDGREYLSPVVRLAREGKIELYSSEKRIPLSFSVFDDTSMANILEPYSPSEIPSGSHYFLNWWTETASLKSKFTEATLGKSPVLRNYLDHFLFLTDEETMALKKWASAKGKDIRKIDLESCREFWREFIYRQR